MYRVLSRLIGDRSPDERPAVTTKGSPHEQEIRCRSGIYRAQRVPDQSGQDPIHRPSLAVFEQMLPVFSHREMNDLEAMSLPASISPA